MERKMDFIKIYTLKQASGDIQWPRDKMVAINFDMVQSFDAVNVSTDNHHWMQEILQLRLSYASGEESHYILEKDFEYINDYLRGEGKLHKGH